MTNPTIHFRNSAHLRRELSDKEIKEYAESAMNELLGWYGYDKMNSSVNIHDTENPSESVSSLPLSLKLSQQSNSFPSVKKKLTKLKLRASRSKIPYSNSLSSCSVSASSSIPSTSSSSASEDGCTENELITINSANETNRDAYSATHANTTSVSVENTFCAWCRSTEGAENFSVKMTNSDKMFCSEICFTHYRRVNFRRSKTCDWCRHVRHAVNYVDLQDGDNRYQFCSNKCLNQFKLDIFCQETKEHLEMHPHHREQLPTVDDSSSVLITPDLWLNNCISPCNSDKSRSNSPTDSINGKSNKLTPKRNTIKEMVTNRKNTSFQTRTLEFDTIFDAEKEKMNERSNILTMKRKKMLKLRSSIRPKAKSSSKNSVKLLDTPKISFSPNFSSMLPSTSVSSNFFDNPVSHNNPNHTDITFQSAASTSVHYDHHTLCRPTPSRECSLSSANTTTSSATTSVLPIPPLLPITKPHTVKSEFLPSPSMLPPVTIQSQAKCATATIKSIRDSSSSSSSTTATTDSSSIVNSLIPPPTVLIPYPIILPIPLPIPIPFPIPLPVTLPIPSEKNSSSSDNCKYHLSENNKYEQNSYNNRFRKSEKDCTDVHYSDCKDDSIHILNSTSTNHSDDNSEYLEFIGVSNEGSDINEKSVKTVSPKNADNITVKIRGETSGSIIRCGNSGKRNVKK